MNQLDQLLFERSTGNVGPNVFARLQTTRLLNSFGPATRFRFDGGERGNAIQGEGAGSSIDPAPGTSMWAHQTGVNSLAVERFDGRILVSGGSDACLKIWDLEQWGNPASSHVYKPIAVVPRSDTKGHKYGITHLSFYPFDAAAFLSTSYDQTLKLWSTDTASVSGSFDLGAKVYTHAMSPIASHLLVACGTQHPLARLVDLRSGSAVQSLAGHFGAVLGTAWSPRHEHVLATGGVDGAVRVWDVRRAGGALGLLDAEDSLGIYHNGLLSADGTVRAHARRGPSPRAHAGPVNGLAWTDDGAYLVTAGQDRRIRVWDAATGANTLASFGPSVKNSQLASATMFTSPAGLTRPGRELLFWPNETEILVLDLHEGSVVTKLRGVGPATAGVKAANGSARTARNRVMSIAWRGAGGGGGSQGVVMGGHSVAGAVYSAHSDGQIRAWVPRLLGVDDDDDGVEEQDKEASENRAKKRKALDDIYKNLMGRQITFT